MKFKTTLGMVLAIGMASSAAPVWAATGHQDSHKSDFEKAESRFSKPSSAKEHDKHGAAWGYTGAKGPEYWGSLSEEFKLCKTGTSQSPIDFQQTFPAGKTGIGFEYQVAELEIENNGHTIKVSYPDGNHLRVAGQTYNLRQFHYHSPSEHTEDGQFHPMEIHFVHQNAKGALAVIGVFVDQGPENLALREIWEHLPKRANQQETIVKEIINARDLIPLDSGFYRYMGSLTTPPCSEGVNWFVMKKPITASKEQLDKFRSIMEGNNRPTQPVNQRLIVDLD